MVTLDNFIKQAYYSQQQFDIKACDRWLWLLLTACIVK